MPAKTKSPSATRLALALLGAASGRPLSATALVGAAELLGSSGNAMRIALSRLVSSGDVELAGRGRYQLASAALAPVAHVRTFRTGFARRVAWKGGFLGVLTADLPRRHPTLVRRRERALDLVGLRLLRHGVFVRPDNLEGGMAVVAAHLARLGLDEEADVVGLTLDASRIRVVEKSYDVPRDTARAVALEARIHTLLGRMGGGKTRQRDARESFFLGDEVLRFLARDPLLPESLADPAPRRALAEAMTTLDARGHEVWNAMLDEFDDPRTRA